MRNVTKSGTTCIMTIELLTKENQLLLQNKAGNITCWQIDGFELTLQRTLSTDVIGFCKISLHKTNMLLSMGNKSTMNCYSIETFGKVNVFDPRQEVSLGDLMAIKSIEDYVFCGYESNIIIVWKDDLIVSQYNFPKLDCLMALDVDHNLTKGVCAGSSDTIISFCIEEGQLSKNKTIQIINPGVSVLQLRPDDKILAAACWDFTVKLFSWKSMKLLAVLDSHSTGVLDIVYSELSVTFWKTKFLLAIANKDNKVTLWDIYNKKDND